MDKNQTNKVAFYVPEVALKTPEYLRKVYWWAYEHPLAVAFWDHALLINLILLGNYNRLVESVLREYPNGIDGSFLQVSCAYGKLTSALQEKLQSNASLDVIDVLQVQLDNVARKLKPDDSRIRLMQCDASKLMCSDNVYDHVLLFFLPHELPQATRLEVFKEAYRVTKPGGKIIVVDFHRPTWKNPFYLYQKLVFLLFEPFALDMWKNKMIDFFPPNHGLKIVNHETFFGSLYQKLVVLKP